MSKWSEKITEFEGALSITNKFWLFANALIGVGGIVALFNAFRSNFEIERESYIYLFLYTIASLFVSELCRRIVIGFGYVLLSIENKLPIGSSTNSQFTKNDESVFKAWDKNN